MILDSQVHKVYAWENALYQTPCFGSRKISRYSASNLIECLASAYRIPPPSFEFTTKGNSYCLDTHLVLSVLTPGVIFHEFAHVIVNTLKRLGSLPHKIASHGAEFVGYYVDMLQQFYAVNVEHMHQLLTQFNVIHRLPVGNPA